MTKNGTPTRVYLDPGMHPGLEVKGLNKNYVSSIFSTKRIINDISSSLQIHGAHARVCVCWKGGGGAHKPLFFQISSSSKSLLYVTFRHKRSLSDIVIR